jgi:histidinol phosphatase-like PHP family hydrolase
LDFREFLGHLQGHNYQVVQNKVEIFELLEIVAAAGGYCVLAHPVKTMKKYFVYLDEIVGRLSEKGLFGVEAFARKQDKEQTAEIIRMCGKHNIRYYAGADTHELKDLLRYIETMAEVL